MSKAPPRRTISIVLATIVALLLSTAAASARSADPTLAATEVATHLSLLKSPQQTTDTLPALADFDGLVRSSSRLLGTAGGAQHWAAVSDSGQICLVTFQSPPLWAAAWTCKTSDEFAGRGLTLHLTGPSGDAVESYLVPDGYAVGMRAGSDLRFATPNLAVSDPTLAVEETTHKIQPDDSTMPVLELVDLPPQDSFDSSEESFGEIQPAFDEEMQLFGVSRYFKGYTAHNQRKASGPVGPGGWRITAHRTVIEVPWVIAHAQTSNPVGTIWVHSYAENYTYSEFLPATNDAAYTQCWWQLIAGSTQEVDCAWNRNILA